jgi:CubicO group peptidase (beta-lactamase class C family)
VEKYIQRFNPEIKINQMLKSFFFAFILVSVGACSANKAPENTYGEHANPQSQGIDEAKMLEALDYLKSKSFQDGIEEVVIIRNGKTIYEGDSVSKKHSIYSCSKVFTSTVFGLLIADGKVKPDDFATGYEPTLTAFYPEVTFRHFATMTSGYSAQGRSRWNDENADWSLTPYTPEKPHFAPGTQFEYWDEAQMMYGKILTNILGKTMKEYLTEKITGPIGMGEWHWDTEQKTNGIPINNGCTGVNVDAMQLARFGQLYLNKGKWNGKQLLPEEWCKMATTNQVPANIPVYPGDRASAEGSGSYGYNWWVNSADGLSRMPDTPLNVAYMSGKNHNVCCLIPEWNMVIVRMGDDQNPTEGKHVVWNEFLKRMGESRIDK